MTNKSLTDTLGHRFGDPTLLAEALTHRSAARRHDAGYERLEFLGDRVLALVITDMLMAVFPEDHEGALARRLADLVRQETLAAVARDIGLGSHIHLSRSEAESGGRENEAILADVCEAVIAAIYLDAGLDAARRFVERCWRDRLDATSAPPQDAKTTLQEWAQGRGLPLPSYDIIDRTGPDHAPEFRVSVTVEGHRPVEGSGPSKRTAEQAAAERLLAGLKP